MAKLTENQTTKLAEALDIILSECDMDEDPNPVIVKVAKDMKLTRDYLPTVVQMYNNSAQSARLAADTLEEKIASFPTANLDKVKSLLYPDEVKTASFGYLQEDYDDTFDLPPIFHEKKATATWMTKEAAAKVETKPKKEKKERRIVSEVNQKIKKIDMDAENAFGNLKKAIYDLKDSFKQPGAPNPETCVKFAGLVYGDKGKEVMTYIVNEFPEILKYNHYKTASALPKDHEFYGLLETAILANASHDLAKMQQLVGYKEAKASLTPMDDEYMNLMYGPPIERLFAVKSAAPALESNLYLRNNPERYGLSDEEDKLIRGFDDPVHESTLRNILISSYLTDIINTDPYLSKIDNKESILDAYNELVEIAPQIQNKKALIRSALRNYLESNGDLSIQNMLADMSGKMQDRESNKQKNLLDQVFRMQQEMDKSENNDMDRIFKRQERIEGDQNKMNIELLRQDGARGEADNDRANLMRDTYLQEIGRQRAAKDQGILTGGPRSLSINDTFDTGNLPQSVTPPRRQQARN